MTSLIVQTVFVLSLIYTLPHSVLAQDQREGIFAVSNSVDKFATKLLDLTRRNLDDSVNIALSPYTIWTLLAIISEGAQGNTLQELKSALSLPQDMRAFRNSFHDLSMNLLQDSSSGVSVDITNAIFVTDEFPLNETFRRISEDAYNVNVRPINFKDTGSAIQIVNNYINEATHNRIHNMVNSDDLANAEIFMTSVLYFKGNWRYPFNKTATKTAKFYADDGRTPIGSVEMMFQSAPFPYAAFTDLKAFVAELPYGDTDKYSMFVLVPSKNEKLNNVLEKLSNMEFGIIIDRLAQAAKEYEDEEIEIFLPKFTVNSEFTLNIVLNQMGINDVFNSDRADLLGIFPQYLYLNRVLQKAVIEVDEVGTVASSATGGSFAYKTMKPKLNANKPFAYFIVDKTTRSVIFEGKVSNPKGICTTCTGI